MSLMFAKQFSEAGVTGNSTGRKGGRGKGGTGLMAKSKRGKRDQDDTGESSSGGLFEGSGAYRTHMLFPGRKDEETTADPRRSSGSPGFMKTMMSWGKRPSDPRTSSGHQFTRLRSPTTGTAESQFDFTFDPLTRKTVSFHEGVSNQLNTYPVPYSTNHQMGEPTLYSETYPTNQNGSVTPYTYPVPYPTNLNGHLYPYTEPREEEYAHYGGSGGVGGAGGAGGPGGPVPPSRGRGRGGPMTREELQKLREDELASQHNGKDCFIIPQANLARFLPDGVTLPREPRKGNPLLNILEVEDPKLIVSFHLMGQLSPLNNVMENPLVNQMDVHLDLAKQLLKSAQDLNATEGYLFKNLEKDADYPYINYYVIKKPRELAGKFYTENKLVSHDTLSPTRLGYSVNHSMDLYDEVATIARPPVDPSHKQPSTLATGYIICIYQVFKGDDGEKFERNWLYWTGARMLYKNLPRNVGLKRLTLHKSATGPNVNYILLVECSHFLDNINQAANLLPVLRARICGYTGIFRIVESF